MESTLSIGSTFNDASVYSTYCTTVHYMSTYGVHTDYRINVNVDIVIKVNI